MSHCLKISAQQSNRSQTIRFIKTKHKIHKLYCLTCRSLYQIVDNGQNNHHVPILGKVHGYPAIVNRPPLHAAVEARADERQKLERLCRYISRPANAERRLSLTPNGNVCYQLKTPYRDGTTHVIFEPLDFIARMAVLVPKPRVNLARRVCSQQ